MKRRIVLALVALALLGGFAALSRLLLARRPVANPAMAETAFAALGGLRSLVEEAVWFRADRLQDEGRYAELAQLASALTLMEPHTPEVWSFAAWNLAYNVSVMMRTPEDRWRWVLAGIALLRDRGLEYNPTESEIYRELAWMFEIKLGADIDSAASVYRLKWKELVTDVAARGAWSELRMDPSRMREIENLTGFGDWTNPQLSAIYWAVQGLRHAKGRDQGLLREIIRQASVIYRNGGARRHPAS